MKKIVATLIIVTLTTQVVFGTVVDGSGANDSREFVSWAEWNDWKQEMQDWFDINSELELIAKVASASELHGYKSENFDWNPRDYIVRRNKATTSSIN